MVFLVAISGVGLTGCEYNVCLIWGFPKEDCQPQELEPPTGYQLPGYPSAPSQQFLRFEPQALGSANSSTQAAIAPFLGNLSYVTVPSVLVGGLQRQADCSLTYFDFSVNVTSNVVTATPNSQVTHVEQFLHNQAFLTTTPDLFPNGCADPSQGITSRPMLFLGTGKNGRELLAGAGSSGVVTSGVKSDGTFTAVTTNATSIPPVTVVSGDLNKDGNQDVISINSSGLQASVTVFLGNSDGSYQAGVNYPLPGANAQYGVLDDLNGDGILDLLVSSDNPTFSFSIFLGNGDGTFKSPQTFTPAGVSVSADTAFVTGDVNGDGHKDIVTAQGLVFLGTANVATYTLASQAAFPPITTSSSQFAPSIVMADFNKDGKADVATNDGVTIRISLGKEDGTFTTGPAYTSIGNWGFLTATDLDGDGNIDLWTGYAGNGMYGGDSDSPNLAYALMGNGDGTFQGAASLPAAYTGTNLADLNMDGHLDFVELGSSGGKPVFTSLLGQSNGTFVSGPQLAVPNYLFNGTTSYPVTVDSYAVGDFNGDKIPDLIYLPEGLPVAGYFLAIGNGDGSFKTPTFITAPSLEAPANDLNETLTEINAVDFNHDGKLDLLYSFTDTNSNTSIITEGFVVQLGNGDGTFQAPQITTAYASVNPPVFAFSNIVSTIADVNQDNFPDVFVVVPTVITSGVAQHQVELFIANGDGTFKAPSMLSLTGNMNAPSLNGFGIPIVVADLNKDGRVDLVAGGSSADGTIPELAIALGNGDGTFQPATILQFEGFGPLGSPAVADFDGDGNPDIFVPAPEGGEGILPGVGDGTFQTLAISGTTAVAPTNFVLLDVSGNAIAKDLNGDNLPDLIVGSTVLLSEAGSVSGSPAATNTAVVSSASPSVAGQSVKFTATVTSGTAGTITGTVTFFDGTTTLGSGPVGTGGVAIYTTSSLGVGSHSITASYGGDANFSASTSSPALSQVVNQANTTTTVLSSANPSVSGQAVTFTATVTAVAPGAGTPSGSVTFSDNGTSIGTAPLSGGQAALPATTTLTVGAHPITAQYTGDANFAGSMSAPALTQTVNNPPSFTISAPSTNAEQVQAGKSATPYTFTVSLQFNSTQTVTFACTGLPTLATCQFLPPSVTLDGTHTSAPVSVTINTTADTLVGPSERQLPPADFPFARRLLLFATAVLVLVAGFVRHRKPALLASAVFLIAALAFLVGCTNGAPSSVTFNGSPPGTSTVVVTGNGTPGNVNVSAPSGVALTVTQ